MLSDPKGTGAYRNRAFEFCVGLAFIGFSLLAHGNATPFRYQPGGGSAYESDD
jgi:hypothetical protein